MRFPLTDITILVIAISFIALSVPADAVELPKQGDWVRYRIIPASEWIPAAAEYVTVTLGEQTEAEGQRAWWWQMVTEIEEGRDIVIQVLSARAPMMAEHGDIGIVYRYIFSEDGRPALEYIDGQTGIALLPKFGFRTGLIPNPKSRMNTVGPFMGTGNYLGQALAVHAHGSNGEWIDLQPVKKLTLNEDVLIGTSRMFKDDGTGTDEDGQYTYIEFTADDYAEMFDAGFNLFVVNQRHEGYVRDHSVFFIKRTFSKGDYPGILYRSNYWATTMYADEPAVRLDASECATVYDAANLLRLRNYSYFRTPESLELDRRVTQINSVINLIQSQGYSVGDWLPLQTHVPIWETIYETNFYQLEGGAAGIVHEGRYQLDGYKAYLENVLGPGVEIDLEQMYNIKFGFMRGAARCFNGEWGTSIYGQVDYSIAPDAVRQAYDMGAHYIWFWTSDHDHHLPFPQQLELARVLRAHQRENPRTSRTPQIRNARMAVAIPDGYTGVYWTQWNNPRFRHDKLNEYGVPYGDVVAEAYWQAYRLIKQGVDVDILVDVPHIIDRAGYEKIVRVGYDARTNLPVPRMPVTPPDVKISHVGSSDEYEPRPDAPVTTAKYVKPGRVTIDGRLDEWENAQWISLEEKFIYDVVHEEWGGEEDLSAQVAFMYDDEAIYIGARVRDDVHHAQEPGDLIWQNDSIQIAFDPLFNPHPEGFYALDDSEIGFSLIDGSYGHRHNEQMTAPPWGLWHSHDWQVHPYAHRWDQQIAGPPGELPGAEIAIIRKDNMTFYEARVPFSELWPLTPSFPGRSGVNAVVNDSDGGLRRGAIAWTSGLADGKNPSRFGVLEFENYRELEYAPPMAFAQVEKTVVRRGEDLLFRLDTGARSPSTGELTVKLRHHELETLPGSAEFTVPSGMNMHRIAVDTTDLESGSYRAELTLSTEERTAVKQSFRVYVLP